MADCFPVKLLSIQRHHVMMKGADPFQALQIDTAHIRVRLEQEIRNHLTRLRYAYVLGQDSAESLAHALGLCTKSLWVECETLLYLLGETPRNQSEALASVARQVGLDLAVLEKLSKPLALRDVPDAFVQLLAVVERLTGFVDTMETRHQ